MAREIIKGIVWGENVATDPANLLKPSDAVILQGWPQGKPTRQVANWLEWHLHQNLEHLESQGLFLWDPEITYDQYALVRYGTKHYISLTNLNTENIPSSSPIEWQDYYVWLAAQAGQAATNQTIAQFNEAYFFPHPAYATGTTIELQRDNLLLPNLQIYPLSANPLTVTVGTLVSEAWYYVYVDEPAGSDIVAGDCSVSTLPPTFDAASGLFVSGTKRCIGYLEGNHLGNGQIEPFIVAEGWYQRRDQKRRLALYTPSPQTNTTLFAGVPNFGARGLIEITAYCYETQYASFAYADSADFSGTISDEAVGWVGAPDGHLFNGQVTAGLVVNLSPTSANAAIGGNALVICDPSGNLTVCGHDASGGQDESMAFWLRKFKLPRGIF